MYLVEFVKKDIMLVGVNANKPTLVIHLVGKSETDGWSIAYVIHKLKSLSLDICQLEINQGMDFTDDDQVLFRALINSGFRVHLSTTGEHLVSDKAFELFHEVSLYPCQETVSIKDKYFNNLILEYPFIGFHEQVDYYLEQSKKFISRVYIMNKYPYIVSSETVHKSSEALNYVYKNPEFYYLDVKHDILI